MVDKTKDWLANQKLKLRNSVADFCISYIFISHDIKEIFHRNNTALIYRGGTGIGGLIHDTGLYYTEGFKGYYIDGQRIDILIFSYTAVQLEDGSWTGSTGPSFGPISFENYGPEWYQWSLYATVSIEGGIGYNAGISYSVDIAGFTKDVWHYIFGED